MPATKTSTKKTVPSKATLNKVVSLRDKKGLSWVNISKEMGLTNARAAVRLYDKALGKGAHYNSHPLPGGRRQASTNGAKPAPSKAKSPARQKQVSNVKRASKAKSATTTPKAKAKRAVKATEDSTES